MIRTDGPSITTANKLTGNDQMFYVKKFKDGLILQREYKASRILVSRAVRLMSTRRR